MLRIGLIVGLGVVAAAAGAAETPREIVVTGEGRVEVTPDMATVGAGVETQAETAAAALSTNGDAMRAVLAALEEAGIARRDIQTSHISLEPVYRQRENTGEWTAEVIAYLARNTITVRVREIGAVGRVIDAMSAAGMNRIGGIAFTVAETRPHLDEAREEAVRDGRARAELFAAAAGVELGEVVGIRETQPFDRPYPMARAEMAMDGAIAEGTVEITSMVEIVYAIADGDEGGDGNEGEGE